MSIPLFHSLCRRQGNSRSEYVNTTEGLDEVTPITSSESLRKPVNILIFNLFVLSNDAVSDLVRSIKLPDLSV